MGSQYFLFPLVEFSKIKAHYVATLSYFVGLSKQDTVVHFVHMIGWDDTMLVK